MATLLLIMFAPPTISHAADISHASMGDSTSGFIIVSGKLNEGDKKNST